MLVRSMIRSSLKTSAVRLVSCCASPVNLRKTPLHEFHLQHGGKMVPFAGWDMPVQYEDGVMKSHLHTRKNASLFDVAHMKACKLHGKDRVRFIESLTVGEFAELNEGQARLSVFTNDKGGIRDDTVISRYNDHIYIVVNAGCAEKDIGHMKNSLENFKGECELEVLDDFGLLALQGPKAASVLQSLVDVDLSRQPFMHGQMMKIKGLKDKVLATRCGYTGEDGFEFTVPNDELVALADLLCRDPTVKLAGLGARDSLRLEAGLCLYGNDITDDTTPIEGALAWTIGKRRRKEANFPGAAIILDQLKNKTETKRRVGFVVNKGAPARQHDPVLHPETGETIGEVTSGCFGPSVRKAVGMAYVPRALMKAGTPISISIRGKVTPATVTKMPFVEPGYYKM